MKIAFFHNINLKVFYSAIKLNAKRTIEAYFFPALIGLGDIELVSAMN